MEDAEPNLPTDDITFVTAAAADGDPRGAATKRASLPAAHEVRQLRSQVQRLERQLAELTHKWRAALLPSQGKDANTDADADPSVLLAACAAAREKACTARVERQNAVLRDQLMQQQLFYASLQDQLARKAPLGDDSARATALFASMHAPLRLCARSIVDGASGASVRQQQLRHWLERGVAEAGDVVDAFTNEFLPLASTYLPFTSTSVAPTTIRLAGKAAARRAKQVPGTLVSNVFVCKLPAESDVPRVFRMVVDNLKNSPAELSKRLGIHLDFSVLPPATDAHQMLDMLGPDWYYGQVMRGDGTFKGVSTSVAFAAELVHEDLGVALMDFVDEDDELEGGPSGSSASYSIRSRSGSSGSESGEEPPLSIDTCSLVTVSRMKAPEGEDEGKTEGKRRQPVLLRRLRVHRYNLPPHSPTLHRDLELHLPFLNGDLHLEMLSAAVAREGAWGSSAEAPSSHA